MQNDPPSLAKGVQFICKIDPCIYSCVTPDLVTDDVVITDERIQHIAERHPGDMERYRSYLKEMLETPDYILEDKPNTALILKVFATPDQQYFRLALRLLTSTDDPSYKNSILTFMKTNAKKWEQNLNNKKVLYRRK